MKALVMAVLVAAPLALAAQQVERHALSGSHVAVYNLGGVMRVEAGTGADVVVEVTRGGGDAATLRIDTGPVGGRETLRVVYPDADVVYSELGRGSSTQLDVRDDGTFNDRQYDRRHDHHRSFGEGRRVRISGSGRGLDAHADVRVAVPAGKRVEVYLAVGRAFVANVNGDLRVGVASADVTAAHTKGSLVLDTGSGDVHLTDAEGDASLDTGSGSVTVSGVRGGHLKLDTGSGDVTAERIAVDVLKVDTGSGDVTATAIHAPDVSIDTGSGSVRLDLLSDVASLYVNTGSGAVALTIPPSFGAAADIETGSGEIDLQDVAIKTTRLEKSHMVGDIGDGKGRMRIETGSGGVRLARSR